MLAETMYWIDPESIGELLALGVPPSAEEVAACARAVTIKVEREDEVIAEVAGVVGAVTIPVVELGENPMDAVVKIMVHVEEAHRRNAELASRVLEEAVALRPIERSA